MFLFAIETKASKGKGMRPSSVQARRPPVRKSLALCAMSLILSGPLVAQNARSPSPVPLTAAQDHQNMMDQLGIKKLREGPSGDENAPNHANYDESKANPFPHLPDVLTLNDGKKVTTPAMWWNLRRPEIAEDFSREVYGRVPKHTPKVTWKVLVTDKEQIGFTPVIATKLLGHVDNSADPLINVDIQMTVVVPANVDHPVPLLMMFRRSELPSPAQPPEADLERINAAAKALLLEHDPSLKEVFEKYPAYDPIPSQAKDPFAGLAAIMAGADPPTDSQLVSAGWGYAAIDPACITAHPGAGVPRVILGLVNTGPPLTPDDWGALRAWAWGAGKGLDYLETDPAVDAKHVGIEGVSRYGKAALVTMAFDQRFYMGLIGSSGEGGAKLNRRNWGETVESLTGGEYYWMAGNFMKYGAAEATFGSKNANDLPVDSHELIAMCAPRLVFISYGIPEKGDSKWLDQKGSYMATVAAQPVYQLLGAPALGVSDDYNAAQMPPVNDGLLDGKLAWRQDDGGHTDAPNVKYFIKWADKWMKSAP